MRAETAVRPRPPFSIGKSVQLLTRDAQALWCFHGRMNGIAAATTSRTGNSALHTELAAASSHSRLFERHLKNALFLHKTRHSFFRSWCVPTMDRARSENV